MKKQQSFFLFAAVCFLFSCNTAAEKSAQGSNQLVGTWKLISFSDFDSATNKWVQPYGEHPFGYFTYTKSGVVNLNVSAEKPLHFSADSAAKRSFTIPELLACNGANYFGTYIFNFQKFE